MRLFWRLGFPGWQFAAMLGLPIKIKVDIRRDAEANVYFAVSNDIGLAVESESLDGLVNEIHAALPILLQAIHPSALNPRTDIRLHDNFVTA